MRFLGAEATPQANEESAAPKPWGSPHRLSAHQIQAEPAEHVSGKGPPEESIAIFGDLFAMRPVLGYELYFAIQTTGNCIVRIGHGEPYPE
jgi:hypothetical protein